MGRPVGSFKPFIRTVPPKSSTWSDVSPSTPADQTLPPLIIPSQPKRTDTAVNFTSWRAPTEWDPSPSAQPASIDPASATRECCPLIPEPSPSICSIRTESWSWPVATNASESSQLKPVHEISGPVPISPSRSPSRAPSCDNLDTFISPASNCSRSCPPFNPGPTDSALQSRLEPGLQTISDPSVDTIYQTSNASRRAKAYVSLGIMWPRETKTGCEYWSATPHIDSIARISRSLRGKKLPPLYRTSPFLDDEYDDEELENEELSDSLQLLSFSQDYHSVLADQYQEGGARRPRSSSASVISTGLFMCGCIPVPSFRSKTSESMSKRSVWRDGSKLRIKHKKSSLWTPLRRIDRQDQHSLVDGYTTPRSRRESMVSHRKPISSFRSQAKGPAAKKRRAGSTEVAETEKSSHISQGVGSDSSSQGYRSIIFRLPRGLALVRLSSATEPQPEARNSCDFIPQEVPRQKSSAVSDYPWRRSSWYNSFAPTSPFAREIPPPLPVNQADTPFSQSAAPSLYQASKTWVEEVHDDALNGEESPGRGLVERARDVRDAWRRHQRETRHDKLKRSIRVLGPVDPTVAAGYTKAWGRRSGDDGSE